MLKTQTKDRYGRTIDGVFAPKGPNARLAEVNKPQSKRLNRGKRGHTVRLPPSAEF